MTRNEAAQAAHLELRKHGLDNWHVRIVPDLVNGFLGLCSHSDECIILNAHHIDIHDDKSVLNTIRHEVAHALTPGHSHDIVWANKAREIGCDNTNPCSNLALTAEAIDAIRSGATLEVEIDEQIIRTPRYKVTRLQDRCPTCNKVAVQQREFEHDYKKYTFLQCGHCVIKELPRPKEYDKWISADANPNCAHEWNRNFCTKCDAKRPLNFQVAGMNFIERALVINKGAGVFDEMGLGKTIQALGYLRFNAENALPALCIVKSGIIYQFFQQSLIWLGDDYIGQVIRTSQDPVIPGLKMYFIPYDLLIPKTRKSKTGKIINQGFDISKLIARGFKTLILDECQLIKNPDSTRTQQVRRIAKEIPHIIPLSGTPWKNRGSEFFTVLNMIAPTKFNSYQGFLNRWVDYYWDGNKYKEGGIRNVKAFKEYVSDIIIRREYNDVMDEYPEVNRTLYFYEIEDTQQQMYDEAESDFVKWWNEKVIGGDEDSIMDIGGEGGNMIARLSRMRHILGLAKIPSTLEYVDDFVEETDKKLVIFVHHIDVGSILYEKLKAKYGDKMPVLKLTSELNAAERFSLQETFNKSPRALMVASTLAAGEGINLQTCSDCVLMERQWNPANEDQAAPGRFKRIGQLATHINVTCVTAKETVDDFLHSIVERKRGHFHAAMNDGEVPAWNAKEIMKELGEAIVNAHNKKKGSKVLSFVKR